MWRPNFTIRPAGKHLDNPDPTGFAATGPNNADEEIDPPSAVEKGAINDARRSVHS
jgi:hypothetical protein